MVDLVSGPSSRMRHDGFTRLAPARDCMRQAA